MGSFLDPLIWILIFGGCAYFFVSALMARDEGMSALSWASGTTPTRSKSPIIEFSRPLVHQFTLQYAVRIKSKKWRKKMEYQLVTAGMTSELNVDEYIGLKLFWGVLMPFILVILNFALSLGFNPAMVFIGAVVVGWMMPDLHATKMRNTRQSAIRLELPFFIDLMALSMEAGLDFQGAIQRIIEKADRNSTFADELQQVLRDITLGASRAEALRNLSFRCDLNEVNSLVNVIIDADSTGASVAKVLKDQSEQMRIERFVRAEKEGAKASQKILIPLVLFILPAVFIMVMAPVALQFMYGGGN